MNLNYHSLIFNSTTDYMLFVGMESDSVFRVLLVNNAYVQSLRTVDPDITREALEGLTAREFAMAIGVPDANYEQVISNYQEVRRTRASVRVEEAVPVMGSLYFIDSTYTPILDESGECGYVLYVGHDITKRKRTEQELERRLEEREVLIREVFHRTHNSMSVIASLLSIYTDRVPEPTQAVTDVVNNVGDKIHAMAAVHARLYQSQSLDRIRLCDVARDVASIVRGEGDAGTLVRVTGSDDIDVSVEVAIPLSMVLQELLSSTDRTANGRESARGITVDLGMSGGKVDISIRGAGATDALSARGERRTGLEIAESIITEQLFGTLSLVEDQGLSQGDAWQITLPLERPRKP